MTQSFYTELVQIYDFVIKDLSLDCHTVLHFIPSAVDGSVRINFKSETYLVMMLQLDNF